MNQKYILIGVIGAIVIGVFVMSYVYKPSSTTTTQVQTTREIKTFYNGTQSLAFNYPDNYILSEKAATGEGTARYTIILMEKTAAGQTPVDSEGPPAITVQIFSKVGTQTAEKWIKGTSDSNFKLSPDGTITETRVASIPAVVYVSDGLYPTTNIVFPYKGSMYMFSVQANAPTDEIIKDYASIVASVQLDP